MAQLKLFHIDAEYGSALMAADTNVLSIDRTLQKDRRPFVGVVVLVDGKEYCIPLSSPKPKHAAMRNDVDFTKIHDKSGKLIAVLNFNNMVPVRQDVIEEIDLRIDDADDAATRSYKALMAKELDWCRSNNEAIYRKSSKLYRMVTQSPQKSRALVKRCCNFAKLEKVLARYRS